MRLEWLIRRVSTCVDIRHCRGYLGHEFMSATRVAGITAVASRTATRFLQRWLEVCRPLAPGLKIGVRPSAFDMKFHSNQIRKALRR